MAISLVNATHFQLGYNVYTVTIPATTANNSLYIHCYLDVASGYFTDPSEISISGGGTWAFDATTCTDTDGGQGVGFLAYVGSCSGGVTTITFTPPAGNIWEILTGYIYEVSGTDSSAPVQAIAAASTPSASITASPASAGMAFAISQSHAPTGAWPAGYTDNSSGTSLWYFNSAYNTATAAGAQTVSNTSTGASSLLVFWPAPGSSGPVTIALVEQTWAWGVQSVQVGRQMALVEQGWSWGVQALKATGRLSLSVKSWQWLTQTADLALRHPLAVKSWSWGTQPLALKAFLALASKSWSWLTQPITVVQSGTVQLAAKLWAWTGQTLGAAKRFALATKSWNWSTQSLYKVGQLTLAGKTWAWQTASVTFHWLLALAGQIWHWQTQAIGGGSAISALGALLKWPLFWLWG